MILRALACLLILGSAAFAREEALRAVVSGPQKPLGVTVLDHRGDLWLVTGTAAQLARLPAARQLAEASAAVPARVFTPVASPLIAELVAGVNASELLAEVEWIVGLGVRYSTTGIIGVVADSLAAKFTSYGLAVEKHWFPMGSQGTLLVPNVIATQTGRTRPDSVFVICAHYDATSENARYSTPGADDNASGVTAVLTAARLLSTHDVDYTIKYVLFAGEEQGLVGSEHWVADMAAAGLPIVGALNFDMIAWWTGGVPFDLEIETNQASRWLADAVCWAADEYTTMPYELHVDDSAWWGDFHPFWQHGYAAVNHEESWDWYDPDFNPYYHSTGDTPARLSSDFFAGSVKIAIAALASLARVASVSSVPEPMARVAVLAASPNPFNGRVVLRLVADGVEGRRTVRIYDLRGQRVGEFAVTLTGGVGEAVWEARDPDGRALPAGLYLARAEMAPAPASCLVTYVP